MNDQTLKALLKQADAGTPPPVLDSTALTVAVRRKYRRRRQLHQSLMTSAVAVIVMAAFYASQVYQARQKQRQVARMQEQIQQLTQQTEATLSLVDIILTRQQQQDELTALNRRLASSTDPLESVEFRVSEAAAVLLFQAEQQSLQPNRQNSAAESYQRILKYFPKTESADTARRRLQQMQPTLTDSI